MPRFFPRARVPTLGKLPRPKEIGGADASSSGVVTVNARPPPKATPSPVVEETLALLKQADDILEMGLFDLLPSSYESPVE